MNRITDEKRLIAEEYIKTIKEDSNACGIAACIIDHTGKVQYENYWGVRDEESGAEVNGDTIFGLASVTKSFTAISIIQMAERGILKIEDPISKYIPEFTNKNQKTVTIQHLLSHTGGFFPQPRIVVDQVAAQLGLDEESLGDPAYNDALAAEGVRLVAERLDALTKESGLNGDPGEHLSYCNDGFALLSDIIRRYGGEGSYAAYLDKNILEPLGMERSGCSFVKPVLDPNSATLYYTDTNGEKIGHHNYRDNAFVLHGGGAMKSTLHDMQKYLAMYLNEGKALNGKRLLSDRGIREMCKHRQQFEAFEYYGYGLYSGQLGSLKVTGHGGSLPGVSSNIAFTYDNDAAVIVLCNTSGVPVSMISDALMRMYNGDDPLPDRDIWKEYPLDKDTVEALAGHYRSGEGSEGDFYVKEDGTAGLRIGGTEMDFVPVSPRSGIVRRKHSDLFIRFVASEERGLYAVYIGGRLIPKVS